jgi:hypothetical protein
MEVGRSGNQDGVSLSDPDVLWQGCHENSLNDSRFAMATDTLLFTDSNILEQLKTAPYGLGYYTLAFYTEDGMPVNKVTDTIKAFYLYPSGGTIRDSEFNIVLYDSRFDTYRGFKPPHLGA